MVKKVLNLGSVELIDVFGDDQRVVDSARISVSGKHITDPERNQKLIDYMMSHKHWSPFEHVVFTFRVKLPIFVARQWIRHRSSSYNEMSGRYRELPLDFYIPEIGRICRKDRINKQGSGEPLPKDQAEKVVRIISSIFDVCSEGYKQLQEMDVSNELTRIVIPLSIYTEWYWTINLRNLFHFLELRLNHEAQWEIREYAKVIWEIIQDEVPMSCKIFAEIQGKKGLEI